MGGPPPVSQHPGQGTGHREERLLGKDSLGDARARRVSLPLEVGEARVLLPLALAFPARPGRAQVHPGSRLHVPQELGVLPVCRQTLRFQKTPTPTSPRPNPSMGGLRPVGPHGALMQEGNQVWRPGDKATGKRLRQAPGGLWPTRPPAGPLACPCQRVGAGQPRPREQRPLRLLIGLKLTWPQAPVRRASAHPGPSRQQEQVVQRETNVPQPRPGLTCPSCTGEHTRVPACQDGKR